MSERRPFPRASRLRSSSDIRHVLRTGRRCRRGPIETYLDSNAAGPARVAIIVPRHGHTAVERNRLKRRLREVVRLDWLPEAEDADLVVRARREAYDAGFAQLRARLSQCLETSGC